ncbi:MAG TPA: hypothetical protein ENF78_00755 [Candidatus Bathyarchaeota archaeon]|nr:hypothetical protein [Candidatus Bathyarchaeota archaeon]
MVEQVEEMALVVDFTDKLRSYRTSLAFSYCFFIWSSIMMGLPLLHTALMFSPWFPVIKPHGLYLLLGTLVAGLVASLALMFYVLARFGLLSFPTPKAAATSWSLSFSIPYGLVYSLLSALGLWQLMPVAWCPAGGLAYLAIGLTAERWLVRERLLLARPFLLMGTLALFSSAPILYLASQAEECTYSIGGVVVWSWLSGPLSAMILAAATYLLLTLAVSLYTFIRAERAIFRP